MKYVGNAAVSSKLVDPIYDPDHFFVLFDTAPRTFEFAVSGRDLQTDRARKIAAMPFFANAGNGLLRGGPDMLASYALSPPTDQLKKGVTNLRNAEFNDICAELNSTPFNKRPNSKESSMKCFARVASAVILLTAFGAAPSSAGTIETQPDGSSVWQAGIDGVEIEFSPHGSFNRIYSKFTQSVAFPDQQGIGKSQIIAE